MSSEDEGGEPVVAPNPSPTSKRRTLLLTVSVPLAVVLALGAISAFALPVVAVGPDRPLASMLPASTVLYASLDLHPDAVTQSRLDVMKRAFTSQRGWSTIANLLQSEQKSPASTSSCYRDAQNRTAGSMNDLGHEAAVAVIGTAASHGGRAATPQMESQMLEDNGVALAPVSVHVTLAQRLLGLPFSTPTRAATYRGVAIYKQSLPACGRVNSSVPGAVYMALDKGYVTLALKVSPIERVIDTAAGAGATLSANPQYQALMRQLPSGGLMRYYLDTGALQRSGALSTTGSVPQLSGLASLSGQGGARRGAGVLLVDDGGFRLESVATHPAGTSPVAGTGTTRIIPAGSLAFISLGGAGSILRTTLHTFTGASGASWLPALQSLASNATGEADLVVARPQGPLTIPGQAVPNVPVSLMWPTQGGIGLLDHAANALGLTKEISPATLSGTSVRLLAHGPIGYTVRGGWAYVSSGLARTLQTSSGGDVTPLDTLPTFATVRQPGATATAVWYVNVQGLRETLEGAFLSRAGAQAATYRTEVRPLLRPIRTLAGASAVSRDGRYDLATAAVRIGS